MRQFDIRASRDTPEASPQQQGQAEISQPQAFRLEHSCEALLQQWLSRRCAGGVHQKALPRDTQGRGDMLCGKDTDQRPGEGTHKARPADTGQPRVPLLKKGAEATGIPSNTPIQTHGRHIRDDVPPELLRTIIHLRFNGVLPGQYSPLSPFIGPSVLNNVFQLFHITHDGPLVGTKPFRNVFHRDTGGL